MSPKFKTQCYLRAESSELNLCLRIKRFVKKDMGLHYITSSSPNFSKPKKKQSRTVSF